MSNDFTIEFYGVRGSYPIANKDFMEYGGNTSCITMTINNKLLIFDAGTGIFKLGDELAREEVDAYLLLTHMHYDHLEGLPFFKPFFNPKSRFTVYSGNIDNTPLEMELSKFITNPMFPFGFKEMGSKREFICVNPGDTIMLKEGIEIETIENNHPSGGISYKIKYDGKACCYLTDNELLPDNREMYRKFAEGVDVLIMDATYTEEEYSTRVGWGHSRWNDVVHFAKEANVGKVALFHHSPDKADEELEKRDREAKEIFENAFCAKEGMKINL